jgi:small-conductance mechanosensitive channel
MIRDRYGSLGGGNWAVGPMTGSHKHDWMVGTAAGIVAAAALVGGSAFGNVHSRVMHPKLVAWIGAAVLLVSGVIATRRLAAGLGHVVTRRSIAAAGAAVRLLTTGVGYVVVLFAVFAVLEVSVDHLLVGAGLAGVIIGIAAQQSLGNVFAALVLLLARPFKVGDHVRIRSGALGGIFDAWVLEVSLTYVTLRTDDGELKIPNSAMLAAGVGQLPVAPANAAVPEIDPSQPPGVGDAGPEHQT